VAVRRGQTSQWGTMLASIENKHVDVT